MGGLSGEGSAVTVDIHECGAIHRNTDGSKPQATQGSTAVACAPAVAVAAVGPPAATVAAAEPMKAAVAPTSRFRMHFVDWLRFFLTVAVLIHHTLVMYGEGLHEAGLYPKTAQGFPTMMVDFIICGFNQAYFMGLFFLLAGIFCTGSFNRKGPWHYITDRAVWLLIPVVVFDLLIAPIIFYIAQGAAAPDRPPGLATASNVYLWYFQQYKRFGANPTWFLVALFLFDCCYLAFRLLLSGLAKQWPASCAAALQARLTSRPPSPAEARSKPFGNAYFAASLAVLIAVLGTVTFLIRIPFPFKWVTPYGVAFKPGYFGQYVIGFGLGVVAYLNNALMRIPKRFGYCCIALGLVWYALGWVVLAAITVLLQAPADVKSAALGPAMAQISGGATLQALYTAFFEEGFAVIWSVGLVVLFRERLNITPNKVRAIVIGAAYAVYIIHPFVLACYGRAFAGVPIHSIAKMVIVAVLLNVTAWPLGAGVKAIPFADRVL